MLEYVKINPAASTAIMTSISVISAASAGTVEVTAPSQRAAEELEEQEWDALVSSPHGQRVLHHLLKEARQQIVAGKVVEGGFGLE